MSFKATPTILVAAAALSVIGCSPSEPNRLDALPRVRLKIGDQPFELWVADSFEEQEKGLMFISAADMAPLLDGTERGMLFVFDHTVRDSFWMKNTIIPLDIAYISTDGTVLSTYTMAALDGRSHQYPPAAPYRFAIEISAQRLDTLGVKPGTKIEIPPSVLKDIR